MTELAGAALPYREEWIKALRTIQREAARFTPNTCYYSTKMGQSHGCPPPLPSLHPETSQSTDTLWQGERVLWAYPGSLRHPSQWSDKVPCACLGTAFWLIFNALKWAGYEYLIPRDDLEDFKASSLLDPEGIAAAAVKVGWASSVFNDPTEAEEGDVGAIGYFDEQGNGELHHWFVVGPGPLVTGGDGQPALNTWAASPDAGGPGFDWYSLKRESRIHPGRWRRWFLARPFA
jgi:hypothetical protein